MMALGSWWNAAAETWLHWLLERSVVAAVTLAVVGVVLLLLRRRLSAHAPSHLLLLPAFLLLLPLERALPTHWPELMPIAATIPMPEASLATDLAIPRPPAPEAATGPAVSAHADTGSGANELLTRNIVELTIPGLSLAVWLLVLLGGATSLVFAHLGADRHLRRLGRRPESSLQVLFEKLCSERGFDSRIDLRIVPGLRSPVATGVIRRAVCLPPNLDRELSPIQLRFVLLHELEHHARRDVLAEGFLRVLRFAFWFHPVAWVVIAAHRRWREYACDEAAVARAASTKRAPVAEALFTLIHFSSDAPRPSGAIASFAPSVAIMKNRLQRILDRTRSPRRSISAASLIVASATGLGALTIARAQQPPVSVKVDHSKSESKPSATPKPDGEVAVALDQGAAWLLGAQQEDGSWDIGPDPVNDRARDHNKVHVTGLALRALMLGWKGPRHFEIVRAVERGDEYLLSTQNKEGLFGGGEAMAEAYGHAQVLRTLCAIQTLAPDEQRKDAIARGVTYAERVRNPYAGWRYRPCDGDNDSKHTALMLLAFQDAAKLGVEVPRAALEHARELLTQLTDRNSGRTGFVRPGEPMSRFVTKVDRFPKHFSEEPTAMRLMVETAFNDGKGDKAVLRRAANIVCEMPPRWDPQAGTTDYAYWCFGAQAMAAIGGKHAEVWRRSLHETLLGSRVVEGSSAHWPADDAWSRKGMEAYSTASAMLALEALH